MSLSNIDFLKPVTIPNVFNYLNQLEPYGFKQLLLRAAN